MLFSLLVSGKNAPYIGGQWEECPLHWWSMERMPPTLVVNGNNAPYIGGQLERMFLTLVLSAKDTSLTLMASRKNVPYIGGQWEECPYIGG
ncbi:unnamed protein product [Staurois parvus]|uniref:Uncharacterized protein n=1 Tax=Staurois parvus TaxID=386267 RepID=A0ABN9GW75_9NEOB|nr:unnamed protein product [Staurois parvus]